MREQPGAPRVLGCVLRLPPFPEEAPGTEVVCGRNVGADVFRARQPMGWFPRLRWAPLQESIKAGSGHALGGNGDRLLSAGAGAQALAGRAPAPTIPLFQPRHPVRLVGRWGPAALRSR